MKKVASVTWESGEWAPTFSLATEHGAFTVNATSITWPEETASVTFMAGQILPPVVPKPCPICGANPCLVSCPCSETR